MIKFGVKLLGMRPEILLAYMIADRVYKSVSGIHPTITEVTGGRHGTGSYHYKGLAIDLRTRDVSANEVTKIVELLKAQLNDNYDVVLESDHIHIEFDPK